MASNIKFKRSAVQNRVPTTAQLELGELALNTYDGKLYTEINTGSAAVVEIGSKLSSLIVDGDNGAGNGDVTFHGATANRDLLWDASEDSLIAKDNAKITVGDDSDLEIFHDGNHTYITNTTGDLRIIDTTGLLIRSNSLDLRNGAGNENYITCANGGAVILHHDDNARVTTTDDGADISGTGSLKLPVGTTAQRSGSPTAGDMRYNSTTGSFEGYSTNWGELGGGGVGIGSTSVNPGSGVVGHRVGVGFTDINFVGAGLSITGYGTTIVVDLGDAITRKYGRKIHSYTATANQTTFAGLSYTNGAAQISVYLNGAKLSAATYTATSGSTVVLGTGASVGDEIEIICIDSGVDITRNVTSYTATANQTTFTGLGYSDGGDLDVYLNGIRLAQSDYTANNGTSLVLAAGASVGDLLEVVDMGQGAQWNSGFGADPDDIYRLNGGVGIGTTNPTDALNITGNVNIVGVITATSFSGIDSDKISEGNTEVETVDTGSDGHVKITTEGTERLRIDSDGKFTIASPSSGNVINLGSSTAYANAAINIYRLGNGYADMRLSSNYGAKVALAGASNNTDEFFVQQDNTKNAYIYNEATAGITFGTSNTGRMWLDSSGNFKVAGISTFNNNVELISSDAGSSAAPELKLYRNSASPADADYLGQIKFAGESDTGVERNYAKITGKILDASNGTEDGALEFAHIKAGSQVITGRWRSDSLQLLNGTNLTVAGTAEITGDVTVNGDELFIADSIKHIGDTDTSISFPSNDTIRFTTGGSTRVTVTDATTTVANNLTVTGNLQVDGTNTVVNSTTMTVDDKNIVLASGSANDAASDGGGITLESGNGNKTWNWVDSTNAWTSSEHINVAAGKVFGFADDTDTSIDRPAANTIRFTTGNDERLRIKSDGKVNITPGGAISGTHPPGDLNIVGTNFITMTPNDNTNASDNEVLGHIAFLPYAAGNIAGASAKIEAIAEATQSGSANPTSLRFSTKPSSTGPGSSGSERLRIAPTGNVSIGGGDPTPSSSGYNKACLHIMQSNSGTSVGCQLKFTINDLGHNAGDGGFISYWGDKNFYYNNKENSGLHRFYVTDSGGSSSEKLQIGSTAVYVTGHFEATTKSFIIDHPTKENHRLRYACLEGPENSVYVRGRTKDGTIDLPDYWTGLVDEDSITVNLTPIGNKRVWVESINNNSVNIASDDDIDCFYTVFAERKDVEKLVVEEEK